MGCAKVESGEITLRDVMRINSYLFSSVKTLYLRGPSSFQFYSFYYIGCRKHDIQLLKIQPKEKKGVYVVKFFF